MVALPSAVQESTALARADMLSHPSHLLAHARRSEIYAALGSRDQPITDLTRCWLSIFVAEKVLPIVEYWYPDAVQFDPKAFKTPFYSLKPIDVLYASYLWINGLLSRSSAKEILNAGALCVDHKAWDGSKQKKVLVAELANNAIYFAFTEVYGCDTLKALSKVYTGLSTASAYNDAQLWLEDLGDSASAAAGAIACVPESSYGIKAPHPDYSPQRMLDFWNWWLDEAIIEAWNRAHTGLK